MNVNLQIPVLGLILIHCIKYLLVVLRSVIHLIQKVLYHQLKNQKSPDCNLLGCKCLFGESTEVIIVCAHVGHYFRTQDDDDMFSFDLIQLRFKYFPN